jgi:diguanylate cyclase (GGDEF)-like protein/PAS domain S-box-containing protein
MTNLNSQKASILIVEDETIVALDIKQRLKSMGYTVVAMVISGEQAIQKAEALRPDLVLMDIKLNGPMDGIQAAEIIRARFKLPVIFLTAFADEPTLRRARITEAFGYILKPFEERELNVNIEMALYRHQMENKLRESEERYSMAIRGANDGIWDWSLKTGEVFYSPRWKEILGFSADEIGSTSDEWFQLIHPDDLQPFKMDLSNHLAGLTPHFQVEYRIKTKKDGYRWILTRGLAVTDADGVPYRMAGSLSDITERKLAEQQLLHDAFHDVLTGLPNRALFLDRLQRMIERAKRYEKETFAVLFLDLDRFKVVNDSLGHQMGDELLKFLAERMKKLLRSSDTLARLGGDEFVILLEEFGDTQDSVMISERILDDLKEPFQLGDQTVFVSASIGIVSGSANYDRPEDILRDADIAMYRAKSAGKARFAVFDTVLREHAITRLELEGDLRLALGRNELKVFYQPILSLSTGKVMGFEALLRWFHPTRGLISPEDFIPLAEETGLILTIGRWVLKEACRQLVAWQAQFPAEPPLTMSINISGRQFAQPALLEQIQQIVLETGLDPRTLKLEMTESLLMENSKAAVAALNRLRDFGVQLLIDDFGMGYSALAYVQHFPIDTIKIDRIFINQMNATGNRSEIARTIIQLARELGLGIIAEGIETEDQLGRLKELECVYGQGWLFSKALSSDKMAVLLENGLSFYQLESIEPHLSQNHPEIVVKD